MVDESLLKRISHSSVKGSLFPYSLGATIYHINLDDALVLSTHPTEQGRTNTNGCFRCSLFQNLSTNRMIA